MNRAAFTCRAAADTDAPALRSMMHEQQRVDPGWPPDYANREDLADWLARPADLGRWVAEDIGGRVCGHVGLGKVKHEVVSERLCAALECDPDILAEICRMVVVPGLRRYGLSGLLTRRAIRAAIEARRIPVATVLENRGTWLTMMLQTGWREVDRVPSRNAGSALAILAPPVRFERLARAADG